MASVNGRAALAGVLAWAASLLAAVLYVLPQGATGLADLPEMSLWSVPVAVIISVTAVIIGEATRSWGPFQRSLAAVVIGVAVGLACFAIAVSLRGGWVVAFPVFVCWAFAGAVGLLGGALTATPRSWPAAIGLSLALLAGLLWTHSVLRNLG